MASADPVADELAPGVTNDVGVRDCERDSVGVDDGVGHGVGVGVGVAADVGERLHDGELESDGSEVPLGVCDGDAPIVTLAVCD